MDFKNFKPVGEIGVNVMLQMLREAQTPSSLVFVRYNAKGSRKPKGQLVHKLVIYGASVHEKGSGMNADGGQRQTADWSKEGLFPLTCAESREFMTIHISTMLFFNGKKIKH
jgi:hypothetical protein